MTIDDLIAAYNSGYWSCYEEQHRAGIRAVVTALRDEMSPHFPPSVGIAFNFILGGAGDQAGTHGSPELDEDARKLEAMGQDAGMTLQDLIPEAYLTPAAEFLLSQLKEPKP